MKKHLLLLSILLIVFFAFGQNQVNKREKKKIKKQEKKEAKKYKPDVLIPISLNSRSPKIPREIQANSQIIFVLENTNTFLYNIEFTEVQRDMVNDETLSNNELKKDFKPSNYKIHELNFNDFLIPNIQKDESTDNIFNLNDSIDYLKQLISSTEFEIMNLKRIQNEINNSIELLDNNDTITDDVRKESIDTTYKYYKVGSETKLTDSINTINKSLNNYAIELNNKNFLKQKLLKESNNKEANIAEYTIQIKKYMSTISKINKKIDFYNQLLFLLYSNEDFKIINNRKEELLNIYFNNPANDFIIYYESQRLFDDLDNAFNELKKISIRDINDINFSESFEKLKKFHGNIDRDAFSNLFIHIVTIYRSINEVNWTVRYQNSRISNKADRVHYKIKLTPIQNDYTLSNEIKIKNYSFDINGGVKVDFSAGFFFHFNLIDDDYSFKYKSDSTTQLVKNTIPKQFIPAAGALFNIYKRSQCNIKPTLNFGLGTNIEKTYYYLGIGALFGKYERIGLSVGFVGGTKKTITNEYQEIYKTDDKIINSPLQDLPSEVPLQPKDPFQIGCFVGITYNLSGKNKEKMNALITK